MTSTPAPTSQDVPAATLATVVLGFGPLWTVAALVILARDGTWLLPDMLIYVLPAALLAWAPQPLSVPALWMQTARDRFRPDAPWLARTVALVPALLVGRGTGLPTAANLAGLAVATVTAVALT